MAIHVKDLSLSRGGKPVLHLTNWWVEKSSQGLLVGPSGGGKTTLLFALGGLIKADSGSITINYNEITKLSNLDQWRGQNIGFVFQELHIIPHLSVLQNIHMAGQLAGKAIDETWLSKSISMLNLEHLQSRYGYELSTGEKQRVAIARAIAHQPQLLLADEPTSGLDDNNAFAVLDLLKQAATSVNATLLIATHDSRLKEKMPTYLSLRSDGEVA
jgi:putative ABC transport system ATP-binding protein